MKLVLFFIIFYVFVHSGFGDTNQKMVRRDNSNALFSILTKKLAKKMNLTSEEIVPDPESDLRKQKNEEIKQLIEALTEIGNKYNTSEIQEMLDLVEPDEQQEINKILRKSHGGKMSWNITAGNSDIEDYETYQEDENAIDHFDVCSDALCNFKGKCYATETDEVFCVCNDWAYGTTCNISATGIIIGFIIAIFTLMLLLAVVVAIKSYLKYKNWRKNKRLNRENHGRETVEEKLELSKLEFK